MIETFCRKCGKRFCCNGDKICKTSVPFAIKDGCLCKEHCVVDKELCNFKDPIIAPVKVKFD